MEGVVCFTAGRLIILFRIILIVISTVYLSLNLLKRQEKILILLNISRDLKNES